MAGSKRSSRLAARRSKPKYEEVATDDDEGEDRVESEDGGSDRDEGDDGDSEFSGEKDGSDDDDASDAAPIPKAPSPAATRASRRRAANRKPEADEKTDDDAAAEPNSPGAAGAEKILDPTAPSNPEDDGDGNDHAEDAGTDQKGTTSVTRSKRLRSSSDASLGKKRSRIDDDGGKLPPSDDAPSESIADTSIGGGDGPPSQACGTDDDGAGGTATGRMDNDAEKGDEGRGSTIEPGAPQAQTEDTSGKDPPRNCHGPRLVSEEMNGDPPASVNRTDSADDQKAGTAKEDGEEASHSIGTCDAVKEGGDAPVESTAPDKAETGAVIPDSANGEPQDLDNDHQTSKCSSAPQINGQQDENPDDNDADGPERIGHASRVDRSNTSSLRPREEKCPGSSGEKPAPSTDVETKDCDGDPDRMLCEESHAKQPDRTPLDQSAAGAIGGKSDDVESAVVDSASTMDNTNEPAGSTRNGAEADETTKPVETKRPSSSSELQLDDMSLSNKPDSGSAVPFSIHYPEGERRTRDAPSVGQLKMALFLESSKAHRGSGPERLFTRYLGTLEKYLASNPSRASRRIRSEPSAAWSGVEATLSVFLKTKKMKRLHNKLVLAIMTEAMRSDVPSSCTPHVPPQWKTKVVTSASDEVDDEIALAETNSRDRKSDLSLWNANLGRESGTWTVFGEDIALAKTDNSNAIRPELVGTVNQGELAEEVLPSSRLPGALEIEPLVRKHAAHSGLTASEHAIWMLVVAVREHASSLIKRIIANDKDFHEGYAPELPNHNQTSLACHRPSENSGGREGSSPSQNRANRKENEEDKRIINSISLSHVLEGNMTTASRLTHMYSSATLSQGRGFSSYPDLDTVNCIINSSIQRAACRRQKSRAEGDNVPPAAAMLNPSMVPPTRTGAASNRQSHETVLATKAPAAQGPSGTSLLPLNKPQFAVHAVNQSMPLSQPQRQPDPSSAASQSMQVHNSETRNISNQKGDAIKEQQKSNVPTVAPAEPITKPGFPGLTDSQKKPEPAQDTSKNPDLPQNPSPATKTSSPPPKPLKRGSKNLAAMMARPSSQPKPTAEKESAAGNEQNQNGASTDKESDAAQKEPASTGESNDGDTEGKEDEKKDSTTTTKGPPRPRGRGFGVKNLAAMRARNVQGS